MKRNVTSPASSSAPGEHRFAEKGKLTLAHPADVLVVAELDGKLDDTPDADGDEAGASDARHDLLQVGHVVGAGDERGGAAKEGVLPGSVHERLLLSLLDGGTREGNVAAVLLGRQRLAGQGSLVNLRTSKTSSLSGSGQNVRVPLHATHRSYTCLGIHAQCHRLMGNLLTSSNVSARMQEPVAMV